MAKAEKEKKYIVSPHQVRSPTLLIGIGGIGGQIVHGVYKAMSDYDRSRVEMLVMDTNINDLEHFIGTGIHYVQTSENKTVQGYLEANSSYAQWFPVNPLINAKNLSQGAGQIRSVSRLGALASKAKGSFYAVDDAIDRLLTNHGDGLERVARVMIVGSATGGTGSGLGVQLPFYVRNVLERKNVPNVLVRGLFLMPSLTEEVQDTDAKKKAVNVNGYAFLKEVNAFYRAQMLSAEDNVLSVEEYVPGVRTLADGGKKLAAAAPVPYDFLFLVEKYGDRGSIGNLDDYIARSAQMVINQLFSPVAARGFSAEDNLITSSVPTGGMNRYCGSGIANAIYPKDEVVRYCTVRYAQEMIQDYWLQIDDTYVRLEEKQRRLRKTDSSLEPLDRGETYCQIFDDMADPQKSNVCSEVAALKSELTIRVTTDGSATGGRPMTEDRPIVECMTNYIAGYIDTAFANSGLHKEAESCFMSRTDLKYPDDAGAEVTDKMERLSRFRKNADETISRIVVMVAESILPSDLKLAQGVSKEAKHNLYVALCEKHPIIARYVLYALRKQLAAKKKQSDERLEERYGRESIFTKDYYREKGNDTHNETPREALDKTPAGWLSGIGLNSAAYTKLIKEIAEDSSTESAHILSMAEHLLKSTAYRIILERMDTLIELYEEFFEELRDIMEQKKEEKDRLEVGKGSDLDGDYKGDKYVCCNAQCKTYLYDEFKNNVTEKELEMSDEVKHGFFDKLFGEYVTRLVEQSNSTARVTHLSLNELFEQGILDPITAQFQEKGFRHLDMSILAAIEKQYKIEKNVGDDEFKKPEQRLAFKQYFNDLCTGLRVLAIPYLSYDLEVAGGYSSGGKLAYTWGLNYSAVARHQSGNTDQGVDENMMKDMFGSGETSLADDSFSPYQMVCYAAIYDLRVENCSMYRKRNGDCAQKFYEERLTNLVDQAYVINDEEDGYLEVIHPHLDCRWHEHAYLPELMGYDDDQQCKDTRLSFMFAVCLGRCGYTHEKTECLTSWRYRRIGAKHSSPVYVDGKELRAASKFALYKAFDCNRVIVRDTQEYLAQERENVKNSRSATGVTQEMILAQPLMQALIGGKQNVLDLLYELVLDSGDSKLLDSNLTDLENFIYEYCLEQVSNHNRAAAISEAVRKAIGAASQYLRDPEQDPDASNVFWESCEHFR